MGSQRTFYPEVVGLNPRPKHVYVYPSLCVPVSKCTRLYVYSIDLDPRLYVYSLNLDPRL
jgi:hypothetical protein